MHAERLREAHRSPDRRLGVSAARGAALTLLVAAALAGCGSSSNPASSAQPEATAPAKPRPSIAAEEAAPGDHSIQEYGSEASGTAAQAVLAAMHSFFEAMANSDYAKVCAGLTASNRQQLAQFAKQSLKAPSGCAVSLSSLLNRGAAAEAKKAAAVTIGKVRIKANTAFVLFRPPAGVLSYFVMKEEGGAWKAISLAPGTPLDPTATP
jgi:type IV pilus biogenesis protein CpaD/CtpE